MFSVTPDKSFQELLKLVQEWPERTQKLKARIVYGAAEVTLQNVIDRIPNTAEYDDYKSSLKLALVSGAGDGDVFAIYADPKHRKVRKVDLFRTVIYIQARRKLGRVKPEVSVLERYNPWTPDTLPFTPKRRDALLVSRRVSRREAEDIASQRAGQEDEWRKALFDIGVRVPRSKQISIPDTLQALPDVAFEALRLELGVGGVQASPHWRPALRGIGQAIRDLVKRDESLVLSQTRLGFNGWKVWPPRARFRIRMSDARAFVPFQDKIGIRVS